MGKRILKSALPSIISALVSFVAGKIWNWATKAKDEIKEKK